MTVYIEDKIGTVHEVETDLSIEDYVTNFSEVGYAEIDEGIMIMADTVNVISDKPIK